MKQEATYVKQGNTLIEINNRQREITDIEPKELKKLRSNARKQISDSKQIYGKFYPENMDFDVNGYEDIEGLQRAIKLGLRPPKGAGVWDKAFQKASKRLLDRQMTIAQQKRLDLGKAKMKETGTKKIVRFYTGSSNYAEKVAEHFKLGGGEDAK